MIFSLQSASFTTPVRRYCGAFSCPLVNLLRTTRRYSRIIVVFKAATTKDDCQSQINSICFDYVCNCTRLRRLRNRGDGWRMCHFCRRPGWARATFNGRRNGLIVVPKRLLGSFFRIRAHIGYLLCGLRIDDSEKRIIRLRRLIGAEK